MGPSFLYTSYGVTWLGVKVHPFMTKKLIAISFKPASYSQGQDGLIGGKESWTAKTRVYQTKLPCTPSEIKTVRIEYTSSDGTEYTASTGIEYTSSNGTEYTSYYKTEYTFSMDKCIHTPGDNFTFNVTWNIVYFGFANLDSKTRPPNLNQENCKDPNLFLTIWTKSRNPHESDEPDINTLFCKSSYQYQIHEVTVDRTDSSFLKADPVGE